MKIQRLTVAALACSAINLLAQASGTGQTSVPAPTAYASSKRLQHIIANLHRYPPIFSPVG